MKPLVLVLSALLVCFWAATGAASAGAASTAAASAGAASAGAAVAGILFLIRSRRPFDH